MQKTGKNAGKSRVFVTLLMAPYTFRRKRNPKSDGTAVFCCTGCESQGTLTTAHAHKVVKSENEMEDEYTLTSTPNHNEHVCAPSGTEMLKKLCVQQMKEEVAKDPTRAVPVIYNTVRKILLARFFNVYLGIVLFYFAT